MAQTITVIPGDGIGPEVTDATLEVLNAAEADLEYDMQLGGITALEKVKHPLPQETIDSAERTRVLLKGPLTTPSGSGFRSINVELRKLFDLYANVRPVRTIVPGGRYEDIDLVLIRENTEGTYAGEGGFLRKGTAEEIATQGSVNTRRGVERTIRYAFELARSRPRRHLRQTLGPEIYTTSGDIYVKQVLVKF